jgi:MFS family permease
VTGRYGYVLGAGIVRVGDEMAGPALLLVGVAVSGAAAGSVLLAGLTISGVVGGPLFGALLDRSHRPGRLLAGALAGYALGLVATLALVRLGASLTVSVGMAVLTGLLNPAVAGGWTAQLPRVFGDQLVRGNSLDGLTFTAAALAGPALVGMIATFAGAPVAVVVSGVAIAVALPVAWWLPRVPRPESERSPLGTTLLAGFTAIARRPALRRATVTSVLSFAGTGMLVVCCPMIGLASLGDAGRGVLLLSVLAASALLANAALSRRPAALRPDTLVWAGALALGAGMLLAALTSSFPLAIVAVAVAGLGDGPQLTGLLAVRHREAPENLRTQIFTTGASLKVAGFAVGSAIAGQLATWSLPGCLLVAAGVEAVAVLAGSLAAARREPRHGTAGLGTGSRPA